MYLGKDTTNLNIEIELHKQNIITGYCHSYFTNTYYARTSIKGSYDPKSGELSFRELKILKSNFPKQVALFFTRFMLTLDSNGHKLQGITKCIKSASKNISYSRGCTEDYTVILDRFTLQVSD